MARKRRDTTKNNSLQRNFGWIRSFYLVTVGFDCVKVLCRTEILRRNFSKNLLVIKQGTLNIIKVLDSVGKEDIALQAAG